MPDVVRQLSRITNPFADYILKFIIAILCIIPLFFIITNSQSFSTHFPLQLQVFIILVKNKAVNECESPVSAMLTTEPPTMYCGVPLRS